MCHRMFNIIRGLDPLVAINPHPAPSVVTAENVSRHCQISPVGENSSRLTTSVSVVDDDPGNS